MMAALRPRAERGQALVELALLPRHYSCDRNGDQKVPEPDLVGHPAKDERQPGHLSSVNISRSDPIHCQHPECQHLEGSFPFEEDANVVATAQRLRRMEPGSSIRPSIRRGRGERGQSLVELALTAPFLIMLLLALVELGNGMNSYLTVLASARDGARLGAQGAASDWDMVDLVMLETERLSGTMPSSCSPESAGVCITHLINPGPRSVRVEVCYDHPLIIGIPVVLSGPLKMCSKTTMRVLGE